MTFCLLIPTRTVTQDRHATPLESRAEIVRRALDSAFPRRLLETLLDRMEQGG